MRSATKKITVHFECESNVSVSWQRLNEMASRVGAHSLEALIHYALQKLKNDLEVAYPIDDGLPSKEHFAAIAKLVPQDIQLNVLSSLFERVTDGQACEKKGHDLLEILSQITEENTHEHIDINDSKVIDKNEKTFNASDPNNSLNAHILKADESFSFQVSLESIDQLKTRWHQEMRSLDNGESSQVTKRLSFETWEDLLSILSEKGKVMVEGLRNG